MIKAYEYGSIDGYPPFPSPKPIGVDYGLKLRPLPKEASQQERMERSQVGGGSCRIFYLSLPFPSPLDILSIDIFPF